MTIQGGSVYLIGAGPGDPELLTIKGHRYLSQADVVVYDRLVNKALLSIPSEFCELIYAGKRKHLHALSQDTINQVLVEKAALGLKVVRLKGGDPFIFGRGGEECDALDAAGIPWEVVPGITAAQGAAAITGIPLTHRDHNQAITLITAHRRSGRLCIDWDLLLQPSQTIAIYMGLSVLSDIVTGLTERGRPSSTPFTVVSRATQPDQLVLHSTLGAILEHPQLAEVSAPALLIMHHRPSHLSAPTIDCNALFARSCGSLSNQLAHQDG